MATKSEHFSWLAVRMSLPFFGVVPKQPGSHKRKLPKQNVKQHLEVRTCSGVC
jgi:hypothetical protein